VTVIGGYLGAGKTTLLNHVLRHADERIAVLVNDFGSVSIDDELIEASDDLKITLQNGCICCSLADGLAVALDQVRALSPRPDRLVIEASGVGDPLSIAVNARGHGLHVDAVVTVVDAEAVRAKARDRYVGDVVLGQVRAADLLVLNKTDLVDAAQREAVRAFLRATAPGVPVVDAVDGAVSLVALLGVEAHPSGAGAAAWAAQHTPADVIFVTWSALVPNGFDLAVLERSLRDLPASVVRVKGVVRCETSGRRFIVHRVGARVEVRDDGDWAGGPSRLVAIAIAAEARAGSPLDALIPAPGARADQGTEHAAST
jgi:G3E family GTPase